MNYELIKTPHLGDEWKPQAGCLGKLRDEDFLKLAYSNIIGTRCVIKTLDMPLMPAWDQVRQLNRLISDDEQYLCSHAYFFPPNCGVWSSWLSCNEIEKFLQKTDVIKLLDNLKTDVIILRQVSTGDIYKEYIRKELPDGIEVTIQKPKYFSSKIETRVRVKGKDMVFTTKNTEKLILKAEENMGKSYFQRLVGRGLRRFSNRAFVKNVIGCSAKEG